MSDEVIEVESKDLEGKTSREERNANGRFAAVVVALILILLAIYHAWIRKTPVLAGILVPALIMIIYGGWVIFLTRRDKKKRLLLIRQMEEKARREIASLKFSENNSLTNTVRTSNLYLEKQNNNKTDKVIEIYNNQLKIYNLNRHHHQYHHYSKKINNELLVSTSRDTGIHSENQKLNSEHHNIKIAVTNCNNMTPQKHHKRLRHRKRKSSTIDDSNNLKKPGSEKVHNGGVSKKPSFRQRLFRCNPHREVILIKSDLKYLELPPFLHRTSSAP